MAHKMHIPRHPQEGADPERSLWVSWCGSPLALKDTPPDHKWACPKCSKAYWGHKLKREPNGYRVGENSEAVASSKWVKSARPVFGPEGRCGYIVFPKGWGGDWQYLSFDWRITARSAPDEDGKLTPQLSHYISRHGCFQSLEQALWNMPEAVERYGMYSARWTVERAKQEQVDSVERAAQKKAEDAEHAVRREAWKVKNAAEHVHMAAALAEMLQEGKITNYQREGLLLMANRANVKPATPEES